MASFTDEETIDAPLDDYPLRIESIEERCLTGALICLEGHYTDAPSMGPKTTTKVISMISRTLEKTHASKEVREALSKNVAIWMWINRIFAAAIPRLTTHSVGPLASLNDPEKGVTAQESTALMIKNHQMLKDDLQVLNKLMHIARNLLVTTEPEIPQDICAAIQFDQMVYQLIILCVNVTSKGYDGEILDDVSKNRLTEITELYKKILVTSLQQAHNWTAKNDRNKMSFWYDILFDDEPSGDHEDELSGDGSGFRVDVARVEVKHWIERNSKMCDAARDLCRDYNINRAHQLPGPLAYTPFAWNWLPQEATDWRPDDPAPDVKVSPEWRPEETDKFEQDRAYGRVSREIDMWWVKARDVNFEDWVAPMPSIEFAQERALECQRNIMHRYQFQPDNLRDPAPALPPQELDDDYVEDQEGEPTDDYMQTYADDMVEDGDVDDDESYGEGPMTGILTEVPNILDPKQIEALHMIVKSCILDAAGSGWTRVGENLQKTRCRIFLALVSGASLLREMLVFIAVWEKDEQSLIFQFTSQIIEAIHHSALIPYAWNSLKIPKDIISPAQTVLLRLVNYMFRARVRNSTPDDSKDHQAAVRLTHFFFSTFRSRVVPECEALMLLQAQVIRNLMDPAEFPVDNWDMERAKDGMTQFLDFLTTVAEDYDMRQKLIEWEATYDLLYILRTLEMSVPKKPLVDPPERSAHRAPGPGNAEDYDGHPDQTPPPPPPPPPQEPAYKFPWAGVKGQILQILAALLQPPPGKNSPGNPEVQAQIVRNNGIISLLNCCTYDDHNRYARERVQLCLKWLMDGSEAANHFLRELVAMTPKPGAPQALASTSPEQVVDAAAAAAGPAGTTMVRVDGIEHPVRVRVQPAASANPPPARAAVTNTEVSTQPDGAMSRNSSAKDDARLKAELSKINAGKTTDELLHDIIDLAAEASRLALGAMEGEGLEQKSI